MKKVKLYEDYFNEAKFTEYDNNELAAYVKNNPKDKEAAKELHKRAQHIKALSRTDESSILENDATATQQLADEVSGELYTAKLKGKSATIKATTTTKTWDDGVPVLKYLARGKAQPVKFELWQRAIDIVHDVARGWFYFTDGRKWYGLHGDEGYLEPSDLPFDMELTESAVTENATELNSLHKKIEKYYGRKLEPSQITTMLGKDNYIANLLSKYKKLSNESVVNEGKEEDEARAILQDLLDEFDPWDLSNMLQPDAEETVAAYGHKGKKAEKIAAALLSMAQNGEFESLKEAADMNDPVLIAFRAAKMNREKQLAMAKPKRKPLYGKQREKAEDNLWQISQDLKDLYADRGQMLIDMEQEAEAEGGPIADEYGDKLNKIEDQIQKLISKRNKLEMMLAENYSEDDINMTYGFYGTVTDNSNEKNAKKLFDQGIKDLKKKYRLTEEEALEVLNSKMGRKAADQIYDGQAKTAVEGLETYYGKTLHRELAEIQKSMVFDSVVTEAINEGKAYKTVTDKDGNTFKPGRKYKTQYGIAKFIKFSPDNKTMHLKSDEMGDVKTSVDNANKMELIEESVVNEANQLKKGDIVKFKDGRSIHIIGPKGDGYDYKDGREKGHHPKGWFDMMISSGKAIVESVVTEAKNTIGLAFKEEQDYLDFVEFIKDEKGSIKKDFGWDSKTKSWEVIMDVKVLDRIYGEGTPSNKESGWYGGLPGDFESVIIESVVTEAKTLDRDEMMIWLEDHLEFVSTSEEFNGSPGGIWISGENGDQYKGKRIYDYYSEDYKNREFGVLTKWEKELNKRGWYSEWYDAGTVMIWPN